MADSKEVMHWSGQVKCMHGVATSQVSLATAAALLSKLLIQLEACKSMWLIYVYHVGTSGGPFEDIAPVERCQVSK